MKFYDEGGGGVPGKLQLVSLNIFGAISYGFRGFKCHEYHEKISVCSEWLLVEMHNEQ